MHGTIYVEWRSDALPHQSRYYGYGTIDGKRVVVHGDLEETREGVRRVRLIIRDKIEAAPT
jgi:hypothetical protein